jgi:RNA polymerase sigma factor (sigma-70 family)
VESEKARELVLAAAQGDGSAWRQLVENFSGLVWSIARGQGLSQADAADALQTTWLRLAEHLNRIENPERVGSWLATTARRESQRLGRLSRRVVVTDNELLLEADQSAAADSPEQAVLDAELAMSEAQRDRLLWSALAGLPERCQELLRVLIASPPPSYADIAAAMDMPVGSIGPTRARCLGQLRARLAKEGISGRVPDS